MTHNDIYTKFMIEYDKANVTSSYPSLTEYEVATVLDKAYNALISQKVTGNNVRRAPFESDLKSVTDLAPLITNKDLSYTLEDDSNVLYATLPDEYLYFINGYLLHKNYDYVNKKEDVTAIDGITNRKLMIRLVGHDAATKFIATSSNIPWIKNPVCYIENNTIYVVYDKYLSDNLVKNKLNVSFIKQPNKFVKSGANCFKPTNEGDPLYQFECNDTVAEELISLAVTFALENVESQRLSSKLNIRGLEA